MPRDLAALLGAETLVSAGDLAEEIRGTVVSPWPQPVAEEPEVKTPRVRDEIAALERLARALIETVEALAVELEGRMGARPRAAELSRLARRVARQLGCPAA